MKHGGVGELGARNTAIGGPANGAHRCPNGPGVRYALTRASNGRFEQADLAPSCGARVPRPVTRTFSRSLYSALARFEGGGHRPGGGRGFRSCEPPPAHKPTLARAGFGFEPFCAPLPSVKPPAGVVEDADLGCSDPPGPPLPGHVPLLATHASRGLKGHPVL